MNRLRSLRAVLTRSYVACEVGETFYALPVEQVQEIVQPLRLTALPHAPAGIIGAVEHRETVVPILDLGFRLGYGETTWPRRKWVLMRSRQRTLGLVVRQVHEVFEAPESDLRPAPEVGNVEARGTSQVLNYRGGMAFVLDMNSVAVLADMQLPSPEEL